MKCINCGNQNSDKAKFCGGCGSKLVAGSPLNAPHPQLTTFNLSKVADKVGELAHKTGKAASEFLDKAIRNAGPIGGQIKDQIRGKEKIIGGGIIALIFALGALMLSGGEPSSNEMEKAIQKVTREQLQALQGAGIDVKLLKFKKVSCSKVDQGGYYCVSEADINWSGPMGNEMRRITETNYYFKTSEGWSVSKN